MTASDAISDFKAVGVNAPPEGAHIRPFAVGKFEVTFAEIKDAKIGSIYEHRRDAFAPPRPCALFPYYESSPEADFVDQLTLRHPAICTSWSDAQAFVVWLSERTAQKYRLPTEAEWEFAARAATDNSRHTLFSFGDVHSEICKHGNGGFDDFKSGFRGWNPSICEDGYHYVAPVGAFLKNAFGLYDMHGNAAEWVRACAQGKSGSRSNPTADNCTWMVTKGGSWSANSWLLASGARQSFRPGARNASVGFRVARDLD
jgi:formylglycine-generating enzyme required for sulfatase activity